jgi:acetoin utilization deacetylase AcuC-like enzyme
MQLYPCDKYRLPLPKGHRFPIQKYQILRHRLEEDVEAGESFVFIEPHAANDEELRRVHCPQYLGRVFGGTLTKAEIQRIGFPWSEDLIERSLRSTGAAVDAGVTALRDGIAASLAGGTHHAGTNWGEGFCVFNDIAVAAREIQDRGLVHNVLVIDCDVHQGNGTAEIFANDDTVYTLSIHGAKNFPLRKYPSSLDVPLADGTSDEIYLSELEKALGIAFSNFQPQLIFYIAGADPFVGDRLGRLDISQEGLGRRDTLVFKTALQHRVPVAIVCGGGYCNDIVTITEIHRATMRQAVALESQFAMTIKSK